MNSHHGRDVFLGLGLAITAAIPTGTFAQSVSPCPASRLVLVRSLSTYELWNSIGRSSIEIGHVVVRLIGLDPEAVPPERCGQPLAVVMIGAAGTGVDPVVLRVYSNEVRVVDIKECGPHDKRCTFNIQIGDDAPVPVLVYNDMHVIAGGQELGQIR